MGIEDEGAKIIRPDFSKKGKAGRRTLGQETVSLSPELAADKAFIDAEIEQGRLSAITKKKQDCFDEITNELERAPQPAVRKEKNRAEISKLFNASLQELVAILLKSNQADWKERPSEFAFIVTSIEEKFFQLGIQEDIF